MNTPPREGLSPSTWVIIVGGCLLIITIPLWLGLLKLAVS